MYDDFYTFVGKTRDLLFKRYNRNLQLNDRFFAEMLNKLTNGFDIYIKKLTKLRDDIADEDEVIELKDFSQT